MFGLFNKTKTSSNESKNTNDSEESDNEDFQNQDNEEDIKDYLKTNTNMQLFKHADIEDFIGLLASNFRFDSWWELNRSIDPSKVEKISQAFGNDFDKYGKYRFTDPIHIAHIKKTNQYKVIDGQHRLAACQKLVQEKNHPIQYIPCIVHVAQTEEEALTLFEIINDRLNFDVEKLSNKKLLKLKDRLDKHFAGIRIWGTYRPYVLMDNLFKKLRKNTFFQESDTEEIFKKILDINKKIKNLPRKERCGASKASKACHEKADSSDFFLGLDKDMKWLDEL